MSRKKVIQISWLTEYIDYLAKSIAYHLLLQYSFLFIEEEKQKKVNLGEKNIKGGIWPSFHNIHTQAGDIQSYSKA